MCSILILVKVKYFEEVQSSPYCAEFNEEFIYVYLFWHSFRFKVHLMVKSNCLHFSHEYFRWKCSRDDVGWLPWVIFAGNLGSLGCGHLWDIKGIPQISAGGFCFSNRRDQLCFWLAL